MEEGIGILICATAEVEGGDKFADGIDGQPQPAGFGDGADAGVQLIKSEDNRHQVAQITVMPG